MLIVNSDNTIDGVKYELYSEDGIHMIKVVNTCDLLEHLYPHESWPNFRRNSAWPNFRCTITDRGRTGMKTEDYEEYDKSVTVWCNENESYYYAALSKDFSMFVAVQETIAAGKDVVVVEYLS